MEIEKAVEAADAIIVCLSKGSITKEGYVQRELRIVLDFADYKPEGTIYILPVRLEECEPPRRLRAWQYADYFEGQSERAFERLLASLKKRAVSLGINDVPLNTVDNSKSGKESTDFINTKNKYLIQKEEKEVQYSTPLKERHGSKSSVASVGHKRVFDFYPWWGRTLIGIAIGIIICLLLILMGSGADVFGFVLILIGCGIAGFIIYPHKLSLVLLGVGFFIFGMLPYGDEFFGITSFLFLGSSFGFPSGALLSRVLYWAKALK